MEAKLNEGPYSTWMFCGMDRKKLVKMIADLTESEPKYLGAPTFAYEIGGFRVTKAGTVQSEDEYELRVLIETLGLTEGKNEPEEDGLTVWIPKETLPENAIENLKRAAEAKQELFKRAFGGNITILVEEDKVGFPWFPMPKSGDETQAYTRFVESLCNMARIQKRVNIKQHPVENEKYEFRCFLLRLGFIGKEYKTERKILLGNLEGSAAFKSK